MLKGRSRLAHDLASALYIGCSLLHPLHRLLRIHLDRMNQRGDLLCRGVGLLGELAHLLRNDGEAASRLACPRRLDGRVEREQIRLLGDTGNGHGDLADLRGAVRQLPDHLGRIRHRIGNLRHLYGSAIDGRLALSGDVLDPAGRIRRRRRLLLESLDAIRHLLDIRERPADRLALLARIAGDVRDGRGDLLRGLR